MNASPTPTRVALLTPRGRGAVSSIGLDGAGTVAVVDGLFRSASGRRLAEQPLERIVYGRWGETGEEVVVVCRGKSRVEIHCHGGPAASQAILASLASAGCEVVSWQSFLATVECSPIRTTAQIALANCSTERTAAILLDQYRGTLDAALLHVIGLLKQDDSIAALARLRELLSWADLGLHLTRAWRVVIAGPPNAGKSTLLNALVGFERAIVFDQPGTTRDIVTAPAAIDGWPIELSDTAGLRTTEEPLEQAGVERATAELRAADLAILVYDLTQPWTSELDRLASERPDAIVVHNKVDLLPPGYYDRGAITLTDRPRGIFVSAKVGQNVKTLIDLLSEGLVPHAPPPQTAVPFTIEQVQCIQAAVLYAERAACQQASHALARLVQATSEQ